MSVDFCIYIFLYIEYFLLVLDIRIILTRWQKISPSLPSSGNFFCRGGFWTQISLFDVLFGDALATSSYRGENSLPAHSVCNLLTMVEFL